MPETFLNRFKYEEVELPKSPTHTVTVENEWRVEEMSLNALTLDACTDRIDRGEAIGPIHTIKLMGILLELQRSCEVELSFKFNI